MKTIQLIIPVYNDEECLKSLLPDLLAKGWSSDQVMIVDASQDQPFPIENHFEVPVIHSDSENRGRAKQMNEGALNTNSDILLFLHADTILPPQAQTLILDAVKEGMHFGGFSRRFDSPSLFLKWTCTLANWRGKHVGWFFGDQAIFVTREAFEKAGGYPEISLFEDLELCLRLKKFGPYTLLEQEIRSSARRFKSQGPLQRTLKDLGLTLHYFIKRKRQKST